MEYPPQDFNFTFNNDQHFPTLDLDFQPQGFSTALPSATSSGFAAAFAPFHHPLPDPQYAANYSTDPRFWPLFNDLGNTSLTEGILSDGTTNTATTNTATTNTATSSPFLDGQTGYEGNVSNVVYYPPYPTNSHVGPFTMTGDPSSCGPARPLQQLPVNTVWDGPSTNKRRKRPACSPVPEDRGRASNKKLKVEERPYCQHPTCVDENGQPNKSFSRQADLNRHIKSVHEITYIDCTVKTCNRKGTNGFTRMDHMKEHLRGYHMIHVDKRKSHDKHAHPIRKNETAIQEVFENGNIQTAIQDVVENREIKTAIQEAIENSKIEAAIQNAIENSNREIETAIKDTIENSNTNTGWNQGFKLVSPTIPSLSTEYVLLFGDHRG
ncbi:hypothetical protein A1O3_02912 [Capronia epimyces CBS 606.96]|uniref:C2H2-type domain-containing protein n=1 Tax=Capronia epimyces CBS 606.96 TaxID=1182542 RepID=W9YJK7_9EURO|nr:uncharacterized protein A1O3_02912 [Capronia epimyces CBS 606.96]EXJ89845.1 hypothetical protein A1O3_02912 [Capronia epimyces CBS 606.96]